MFQRRAYSLALNAFDISGCKLSRKDSVLGKVFEISSAKRRAFQIHAGAENDCHVMFYAIFGDSLPYGVYKRLVERIAERGKRRITNRFRGNLLAVFLFGYKTQPVRAVGNSERRKSAYFRRRPIIPPRYRNYFFID